MGNASRKGIRQFHIEITAPRAMTAESYVMYVKTEAWRDKQSYLLARYVLQCIELVNSSRVASAASAAYI